MDAGFHSRSAARTVAAMEWTLEWRQGHQLASVGLFALSSVYVAFQAANRGTAPEAWTAMLWLVYLFSGFTAVGRLFDRERSATRRYLQWTVDPLGLMLGKLLHAILTTTALSAIVLGAFVLFLGSPERASDLAQMLAAWLGGLSMTTTLARRWRPRLNEAAPWPPSWIPLLLPTHPATDDHRRPAGTPWSCSESPVPRGAQRSTMSWRASCSRTFGGHEQLERPLEIRGSSSRYVTAASAPRCSPASWSVPGPPRSRAGDPGTPRCRSALRY